MLSLIDFFKLIGYPGSVHDSRVFRISDIAKKIQTGAVPFTRDSHLLGDSGYINMEYLLTPYKDNGFLNEIQKNYNYIHSSTRVIVEQAIGLWKGRFRILRYINMYKTEEIPDILLATAVLHNICLNMNDDDVECIALDPDLDDYSHENSTNTGTTKRDQIAAQLFYNRID